MDIYPFLFFNYSLQAQSIEEVIKDKTEKGKESTAIDVDGVKLYKCLPAIMKIIICLSGQVKKTERLRYH